MKIAAIVIDKYKFDHFEKRLEEAGIDFDQEPGPSSKTFTLKIKGETMAELLQWRPLIASINAEATR